MQKHLLKSEGVEWQNHPADNDISLSSGVRRMIMFYESPSTGDVTLQQHFRLTKPGAGLELLIIFIGEKTQKFKMNLLVEHLAPRTTANVYFKAVLFDRSSVEFLGNVKIPAKAQKSDTFLKCDTLLMSSNSRAKTIPSLEIIANDVKAGHSASSGKPDEDALFYLQSRGMDLNLARELLAESFLINSLKVFSVV